MTADADPIPYPFGTAEGLDLHPAYLACREAEPVIRARPPYGDDAWLLTRYHDVKSVLGNRRFSRAVAADHDEARLTPLPIRTSILGMDPPDHTRLRRLLAVAFTEKQIDRLRPQVRVVIDDLFTDLIAQGPPADLVEQFAVPLAGSTISAMLGVPYADRVRFRAWTDAFASTTALPVAEVEAKTAALYAYMADLARRRRQAPRDDLVSSLVQAQDRDGDLAEQELIELLSVLLVAGHDTTASHLASSMYLLITHPEQARLLRREPALLAQAVEELLRFVPLIAHVTFARYATEDVELNGTLIRAGQAVLPAIPSANRDGTIFNDPDELNFRRTTNPHLGLGHGIHRCLGAALAKMELQMAISALLDRLPTVRLAVPEQRLCWRKGLQVRSLAQLPITW
jgi:cytochrome P450